MSLLLLTLLGELHHFGSDSRISIDVHHYLESSYLIVACAIEKPSVNLSFGCSKLKIYNLDRTQVE